MSIGSNLGPTQEVAYQPGVCNIGPAEIARRRRSGHVGLLISVVLLAVLLAAGAPHWLRLALVLPVAVSAAGYLQARFHFCARFGSAGVYNFEAVGSVVQVADPAARARDRRSSLEIGLASLAIGLAAGILAALAPIG